MARRGPGWVACLGVMLLLCLRVDSATVPPVTATWKSSPSAGVVGYELVYGTTSGDYTKTLDAGNNMTIKVPGLVEGRTYYFAVLCYNTSGLRSEPSPEAKYLAKAPVPNNPPKGRILSPSVGGTIIAGQTVDFSASGSDPDGDQELAYRWSFGEASGVADVESKTPGSRQFKIPGTYWVTLTVSDSRGLADPTPARRKITVSAPQWSRVSRKAWKLLYANSEDPDGYAATAAFDGNPDTFWHTSWRAADLPEPPHEIQIDLGSSRSVNGFEYLARQDNYSVGSIGKFEFYLSQDGSNWGAPVATGTFAVTKAEQRVFFTAKRARYIRLLSLSEVNGYSHCSAAEINVLRAPHVNRKPEAGDMTVSTKKNSSVKIKLNGSDEDGNPLTYEIVRAPKHGYLTGNPPVFKYHPDKKYIGTDRFTYRVRDGLAKSALATVKVQVKSLSSASSAPSAVFASVFPAASGEAPDPPEVTTKWIDGKKYLVLSASKPASPDGLKRSVQVSSNLVDWYSGKQHTTVISDNESILKVRDNTPIRANRKRYIRLRITAP